MPRPERNARIVALILAAGFVAIVVASILNRAEHTYRYPDYSSLNNSDLGLKAYHDALDRLGLVTARNYRPIDKLRVPNAAVIQAGLSIETLKLTDTKGLKELESVAANNGRLILLLSTKSMRENPRPQKKDRLKPPPDDKVEELESHWGLRLAYKFAETDASKKVGWFVPIVWYIQSWDQTWTASASDYAGVRILERHFGQGSIVLVPGAELFTNRELLTHSEPKLLTDVLGRYRSVVFDENRLGLQDTDTVAGLAKTHNLQWLLAGFVVLAALYVWRSSVSFVPATEAAPIGRSSSADTHRALTNLLMQSVSRGQLLPTVTAEWNGAASLIGRARNKINADELSGADAQDKNIAAQYNRISNSLHRRTRPAR